MPIKVTCPGCGIHASLPDSANGKSVRCGKCSLQFRVNAPAQPAPAANVKTACPSCGNVAAVSQQMLGQTMTCISCRKNFTIEPFVDLAVADDQTINPPVDDLALAPSVSASPPAQPPASRPGKPVVRRPIGTNPRNKAPAQSQDANQPDAPNLRPHSYCPSCSRPWIGPGPICSECGYDKRTKRRPAQEAPKSAGSRKAIIGVVVLAGICVAAYFIVPAMRGERKQDAAVSPENGGLPSTGTTESSEPAKELTPEQVIEKMIAASKDVHDPFRSRLSPNVTYDIKERQTQKMIAGMVFALTARKKLETLDTHLEQLVRILRTPARTSGIGNGMKTPGVEGC